jgi:hypothetical protein
VAPSLTRPLTKQVRAAKKNFAALLAGGDRRSLGRASDVVALVLQDPSRFAELVHCLWSDDAVVRMRAADAVEKVSRQKPALLHAFKAELLGLAGESRQQEVLWHLAQIISRLRLTRAERQRGIAQLKEYLQDRSAILRTLALQSLADMAADDPALREEVIGLVEEALRSGTAAMKARARKLLVQFSA